MRIALIQPPVEDFYYTPQRSYPLGLTYLAAGIQDLPVEVEIVDLISGLGRQTIPVPKNFETIMEYLPYDRSPISAFHSYYHFGPGWKNIEIFFNKNLFDLYAISSNFYTYSMETIKTAEIIKKSNPKAIVLVGGQNVGPEHSLFTDCPDIDHCIQGEADLSLCTFVQSLIDKTDTSNTPGLYDSKNNSWNQSSIVKDFTHKPSSVLLPVNKYQIAGSPAIMISTSRGCPMGCRFCSVSRTFGCKLRLKPADRMLEEMNEAYARGVRSFDIEDDNFTFVREHCIELLTKVIGNFKNNIKLFAMNGLSAEHLDQEVIDLLYKSGMRLLNLSIATSSEEQLKILHRKTNIEHFKLISEYAANKGMKVMGHFISGLPGQSSVEILGTMKVLTELPLVLGISPFYYVPGMNMDVPYPPEHCKDARLSRFWPADDQLDELDLLTLFRLSRWINYLKSQMAAQKITYANFSDLPVSILNDQYIFSLIKERKILGLDSNNIVFENVLSEKILNSFFAIFKDSDVYCT